MYTLPQRRRRRCRHRHRHRHRCHHHRHRLILNKVVVTVLVLLNYLLLQKKEKYITYQAIVVTLISFYFFKCFIVFLWFGKGSGMI
jgi:hypothetical protein